MAIVTTPDEIEALRASGRIAAKALEAAARLVKPGVKTEKLNQAAHQFITKAGARPSFLGFQGYPASLCVSMNDEVVHGIPSARTLKDGDIVGLDVGVEYNGWFTDTAITLPVGKVSNQLKSFLADVKQSLLIGIEAARAGSTTGDIGSAVEEYIRPKKYGIVRQLCGHGVGRSVHEPPQIPNFGKAGAGSVIPAGLVVAIEPMVTLGGDAVQTKPDGWTVVTDDHSLAAHFEHTVVVTEHGPEIMTQV